MRTYLHLKLTVALELDTSKWSNVQKIPRYFTAIRIGFDLEQQIRLDRRARYAIMLTTKARVTSKPDRIR
jgi:hypothetical protein